MRDYFLWNIQFPHVLQSNKEILKKKTIISIADIKEQIVNQLLNDGT